MEPYSIFLNYFEVKFIMSENSDINFHFGWMKKLQTNFECSPDIEARNHIN